jgi:hypothetical protein
MDKFIYHLTQHLRDSKATYLQHAGFAFYASGLLFYAAIASFIHAIFPFFLKGTPAGIVIKLYNERLRNHPNPVYKKLIEDGINN